MKVPIQVTELAKKLVAHGDVQKILDINPEVSRYEIGRVFDGEDTTPEAIAAVNKFYTEKAELLSDYLPD